MVSEEFNRIVERQAELCGVLLGTKGREYAPGFDRLSAFKKAAALQNVTQAQAAFGMLAKHLVSVSDMVNDPDSYDLEKWDEKIGDSINYLLIIRAIVEEEITCATSK